MHRNHSSNNNNNKTSHNQQEFTTTYTTIPSNLINLWFTNIHIHQPTEPLRPSLAAIPWWPPPGGAPLQAIYKVPLAGWLQVFALAGAIEAKNVAFPTNYGAVASGQCQPGLGIHGSRGEL